MANSEQRPLLTPELTGAEFARWYWTLAELQPFARTLEVSASGRKADVTARIIAVLDGTAPPRTHRAITSDNLPAETRPEHGAARWSAIHVGTAPVLRERDRSDVPVRRPYALIHCRWRVDTGRSNRPLACDQG